MLVLGNRGFAEQPQGTIPAWGWEVGRTIQCLRKLEKGCQHEAGWKGGGQRKQPSAFLSSGQLSEEVRGSAHTRQWSWENEGYTDTELDLLGTL